MLKPLVVANWKCNPPSQKEARHLFEVVRKGIKTGTVPAKRGQSPSIEVVICPPFVWLKESKIWEIRSQKGSKSPKFWLGAQDCFWEQSGAYTGEISPAMLKDLGCQYVIVGHSERRKYFQETDEMINQKIKAALKAGLKPILCVGEETRDNSDYLIIEQQLEKALFGVSAGRIKDLVIAYEPVWAIGTGQPCLPDEAMKTALFIRKILTKLYARKIAEQVRILYGGSVTAKNAADYVKGAGMDGLLVGGASLNGTEFIEIVKMVCR